MKIIINSLGLVFIVLKLIRIIKWSWWWVLCPFWIQLAIIMLALMILGLVYYTELPEKEKSLYYE